MAEPREEVQQAGIGKGLRAGTENQQYEADGRDGYQWEARRLGVLDPGMTHAGQQQKAGPQQPAEPRGDAEDDQDAHDDVRDDAVDARGDGVENVAAVELAGRDEVQRCDEDGDPGGDEDRVPKDVGGLIGETAGVKNVLEQSNDERRVEVDQLERLNRDRPGEHDACAGHDESRDEAGDGAEGSDS